MCGAIQYLHNTPIHHLTRAREINESFHFAVFWSHEIPEKSEKTNDIKNVPPTLSGGRRSQQLNSSFILFSEPIYAETTAEFLVADIYLVLGIFDDLTKNQRAKFRGDRIAFHLRMLHIFR